MGRILLFCILFSQLLWGITFQKQLEEGSEGDFVVFQSEHLLTLLVLRQKTNEFFVFEEISAPKKLKVDNWNGWIKEKAPGHTSWSILRVPIHRPDLLECYSFSEKAWLSFNGETSLLSTLLRLPLSLVDASKQKKIGPPPQEGEIDRRKVWTPPLQFLEKTRGNIQAFRTVWPEDHSPLSQKKVLLYFDASFCFPLWIEVEGSLGSICLRGKIGGKNLVPFFSKYPEPPLEWINISQQENSLLFTLRCPSYASPIALYRQAVTGAKTLMPYELIRQEGSLLTLRVSEDLPLKEPCFFVAIALSTPSQTSIKTQRLFHWKNLSTDPQK